jgi:hypothetical protein
MADWPCCSVLFLFALFWAIIELAVLGDERKQEWVLELPRHIVFDFRIKAAGLAGWTLQGFRSIVVHSRRHTGR